MNAHPSPQSCRTGAWLAAICISAGLHAAESNLPPAELIAATTDLPEPLAITHYDIALETDLDRNALRLQTTCTVRNQSSQTVERVDFDLLAREQFYGAKVNVANVSTIRDAGPATCPFTHACLKPPAGPALEGTSEFPRILRVNLASPLPAAADCRLQFDYSITIPDPAKDENYRLIAQLPAGDKEVCLLDDFSWIPRPAIDSARDFSFSSRNFFTKGTKASWQITLTHPSTLQSLVLDGPCEGSERIKDNTVSRYRSVIGGRPQLLIGPCERVEVPGPAIAVVFLLPKGKYTPPEITNSAAFLQRACKFYAGLFGPLENKPIHLAVSSAGMGGHGAFLGMFLDSLPAPESGAFDETAAHELAHSWWGDSVSSYGRGTKFLRESLSTFAAWQLGRAAFQRDRFRGESLMWFCQGTLAKSLFRPTDDSERGAYVKGAVVLELLRQEMGDKYFYRVLRSFADKFRGGHAAFADFLAVCNQVSQRDWLPFLSHWCYGGGLPAYQLVGFASTRRDTNGWRTSVTFTNAGKGILSCPVELCTAAGPRRERFAVPESDTRAFVWQTAAPVTNVVIDPDHTTLQGDAQEIRLKLLALPETELFGNWPLYWKGVAHGDVGDYAQAEALLSRAVDLFKGQFPNIALYSYVYSRGVVRLRAGQPAPALEDFRLFLDGVLQPEKDKPASAERVAAELVYARLLNAPQAQERLLQLGQLLRGITGPGVPMDAELAQWRKWWLAHRATFQLGPDAARLLPGGIPPGQSTPR